MDEGNTTGAAMGRLAAAAESLERVLDKIEAQYESLNAKVDRIVAAIEDGALNGSEELEGAQQLKEKVAQLEREKTELSAQAQRLGRKTLSPLVCGLLAKSGVEGESEIEEAVLDKALGSLSVEQRIAVKAEMARAGLL
jgi:predicted RNase H-like nuclease (RuvC/YqgF family)